MHKIHLFIGLVIGLLVGLLGMFLFLEVFTNYNLIEGWKAMKNEGQTGKLMAIGAVPNLIVFFGLLKFDLEMMARGVVLATIIITVLSIFL
jgi:hypothetical protein